MGYIETVLRRHGWVATITITAVPAIRTSGSTTGSARSEWLGLPLRTLRSYLPVK